MKEKPKPGQIGEVRFTVEPQHTIDFADARMPAVLSTPWLVNFLEKAGREALKPILEDGENSVGMEIEVKHLAPTPPGQTVTCLARVIRVDDRVVDFQVEASDESELIARGFHKRAVIEMHRFARRVEKKRSGQ
jgi:predicted thioesterase